MPRGQKSKRRGREKRRQARMEAKDLGNALAAATPTPTSGGTPPGSPPAGAGQKPQGAAATSSPVVGASHPRSKARGRGQVEERENSSRASTSAKTTPLDPLTEKAGVLVNFLLDKCKMKEPIKEARYAEAFSQKVQDTLPRDPQESS